MQSDFNPINSAFLYMNENMKNQKDKDILLNIYKKYGPLYVLSAVSDKGEIIDPETPIIDLDYETYKVPNFLDIRTYVCDNGFMVENIIDGIGTNKWTSIRFDLDLIGNSDCKFVLSDGSSYSMEWNKNGFYFHDYIQDLDYFGGSLTPVTTNKTVQLNLGFDSNNIFRVELWFDREKQATYNMNMMFNNNVSLLRFGTMVFELSGDPPNAVTLAFEEPIVQCVSNGFLYDFGINL